MKTSEDYFNQGNKKVFSENYSGAITDFTTALKIEPYYVQALNNRGFAKQYLNDLTGQIEDYTSALLVDPNDETALYNRGITRVKMHDYKGAIPDLTRVLEMNPNDAVAYYFRATARINNNEYGGAVTDIMKAMGINPALKVDYQNDDPEGNSVHHYIQTIIRYTIALQDNPWDTNALFERARLKETVDDYEGAIADYTKIIGMHSINAKAFFKRGYIKDYQLKDYTAALSDYNNAIMLCPNDAEIYLFRAGVKQSINDYQGAFEELTAIIGIKESFVLLDPNDPNDMMKLKELDCL